MSGSKRLIGAHELGAYAYCPRAWWFEHHGSSATGGGSGGESFARGTAFHHEMMSSHVSYQRESSVPYAVAALLGLVALGVTLWWFHLLPSL